MTRLLMFVLVSLALSSSALAQTVERTIEVDQQEWGSFRVQPIEADGNPDTREWLVISPQAGDLSSHTRLKVVAERHGTTCQGDWFHIVIPGQRWWARWEWVRIGLKDMIQSTEFGPWGKLRVSLIGLTVPPCD
jgi:hypothetical protein